MVKEYDLLVIGTGTAGSIPAAKCKEAGWSVAIVDDRPFGGTCAQYGCDPKKVLVGAAELIDWNKRMNGKGIVEDAKINWQELMNFKRTFTESVPEDTEKKFTELGIDRYHGKAFFESETEVRVGPDILKGQKILIATGAKPVKMRFDGEEYMITSDEFLELDQLPKDIVFVGGGFISFEFAHIAARAGSVVHILHRSDQALKHFDQDLVDLLIKRSKEIGIQVHLGVGVNGIKKEGSSFVVKGEKGDRESQWLADLVVHGAGRAPALDMNLEKGNVERDKQGVCVNEYMQSISNPHVYAAGDTSSTDGPPLTPIATKEAHIAAANLLDGNHKKAEYPVVPSVVFTVPKIASVGLSEQEAKDLGKKVVINHEDMTEWFTYRQTNEGTAAFKVLIDEEKDTVLGAHFLGVEADVLINLFAMAIRFQLPVQELKKLTFAYPTAASDIGYML